MLVDQYALLHALYTQASLNQSLTILIFSTFRMIKQISRMATAMWDKANDGTVVSSGDELGLATSPVRLVRDSASKSSHLSTL